ncbi:MAG: 50S ribosomal protein L11 methyltransferase [Bacteroidia bacterium]|nr:50S ribosomal protein L11 methyltransferase [Bacteroidia bacterium]
MHYIELRVSVHPKDPWSDLIMTELAEIGFDSFEENESGFMAYIPENLYIKDLPEKIVDHYAKKARIVLREKILPPQNWNEEWEKNFQPVEIGKQLHIRAEFHEEKPGFEHEIIIQPKMAFGTGHHETTYLVSKMMLDMDFKRKKVLDMGTGTGLLAILAMKLGAKQVKAVDIDEWSVVNSQENVERNISSGIEVVQGGIETIQGEKFDTILANINRNVLLDMAHSFSEALNSGGEIVLSGFYLDDYLLILDGFTKNGFEPGLQQSKNNWMACRFVKK